MDVLTAAGLFVAAIAAGALNSVAGGGSFLTFPSLVVAGVPPVSANATNTVALWPGSLASVFAYRQELGVHDRKLMIILSILSLFGGVTGALLLLWTPDVVFVRIIPFLLAAATLLFVVSPTLTRRLGKSVIAGGERTAGSWATAVLAIIAISVYGGYFGGGMGIMLLATLGLLGMTDIHEMNALKTMLTGVINGIAVVTFVVAGAVAWPQAVLMIVGAVLGGYLGAYYVKKVNPLYVRRFVIFVGCAMTAYFFLRA